MTPHCPVYLMHMTHWNLILTKKRCICIMISIHNTYVTNLNAAIVIMPELGEKTIEVLLSDMDAIPTDIKTAVRNNGGGT